MQMANAKISNSVRSAILLWVNKEAEFLCVDQIKSINELANGVHFYELIAHSSFPDHVVLNGEDKFGAVADFVRNYYERDIWQCINFQKARDERDEFEIAKIAMLILNAVLTTDREHVAICDQLPSPLPRQILKFVQVLVGEKRARRKNNRQQHCSGEKQTKKESSEQNLASCFNVLLEDLNRTVNGDAAEISKRLKFDDSHVDSDALDQSEAKAGSSSNQAYCRMMTSASVSKTPPIGRKFHNTTSFSKIDISPALLNKSPLAKLSQSPLVQCKRLIREREMENRRLKEMVNEKTNEVDNLKAECAEFKQKLQKLDEEAKSLLKFEKDARRLQDEICDAKITIENLEANCAQKDQQIETLKGKLGVAAECSLELNKAKKENFDLENTNASLLKTIKTKDAKINSLIDQIAALQRDKDDRYQKFKADCDRLATANADLQHELQQMKDRYDELSFLAEDGRRAKQAEEKLQAEIAKRDMQLHELEAVLSKERGHFSESMFALTSEVKSSNRKIDELVVNLDDFKKKATEHSKIAEQNNFALAMSRQDNEQLKAELCKLRDLVDQKLQKIDSLNDALRMAHEDNERIGNKLKDLTAELESRVRFKESLDRSAAEVERLSRELSLATERLAASQSLVEKQSRDLDDRQSLNVEMSVEVARLRSMLRESLDRVDEMEAEKDAIIARHAADQKALKIEYDDKISRVKNERNAISKTFLATPQSIGNVSIHNNDVRRIAYGDRASLKSAGSNGTFRSLQPSDAFRGPDFGCEDEPEIMVHGCLSTKKSNEVDVLVESQVAIQVQDSFGPDNYLSVFKRPITPQAKLTFDDNLSICSAVDSSSASVCTPSDWSRRLTILNDRNQLVKPHLKCFYPVETQSLNMDVKEDELKFSSSYTMPESVSSALKREQDVESTTAAKSNKKINKSRIAELKGKENISQRTPTSQILKRFWTKTKSTNKTPDSKVKVKVENFRKTSNSVSYSIANSAKKTSSKKAALKEKASD